MDITSLFLGIFVGIVIYSLACLIYVLGWEQGIKRMQGKDIEDFSFLKDVKAMNVPIKFKKVK